MDKEPQHLMQMLRPEMRLMEEGWKRGVTKEVTSRMLQGRECRAVTPTTCSNHQETGSRKLCSMVLNRNLLRKVPFFCFQTPVKCWHSLVLFLNLP